MCLSGSNGQSDGLRVVFTPTPSKERNPRRVAKVVKVHDYDDFVSDVSILCLEQFKDFTVKTIELMSTDDFLPETAILPSVKPLFEGKNEVQLSLFSCKIYYPNIPPSSYACGYTTIPSE